MADQWDWWRSALKGEAKDLQDDGTVRSGFFWTKASRAGGRIPVAIWSDDKGFHCRYGDKASARNLDLDQTLARWHFIFPHPVERDAYKIAWETGKWPDGSPTVAPDSPASVGDNLPDDPFERLSAQLDDKLEQANQLLARIAKQEAGKTEADLARNMQAELLALNKSADKMHEVEKAPHLSAARAVDEKFRFRERVKSVATQLRTVFENWMRREEAKEREAARKKHEEEVRLAEDERRRILAEREKKMAVDPIAAMTDPEPELPIAPSKPEPVKVNAGGGVGRAAGLKTVWEPEIVDYDAVLEHFSKHPDVVAAIEKLVKAAVRVGKSETKIPGVTVREERRAA